jgi:hypothetical protein
LPVRSDVRGERCTRDADSRIEQIVLLIVKPAACLNWNGDREQDATTNIQLQLPTTTNCLYSETGQMPSQI